MKLTHVIAATLAVLGLLGAVRAVAGVPEMMNYQGRLTDGSGAPLDTTVSMTFTIYDDSTGSGSKWTETHPSVVVTGGTFNVILGAGTPPMPIEDSVFAGADRYLGIAVGGDPEITPRTRLVSVAYSHRVSTVDGSTGGVINGDVDIQSDLMVSGKATIGPGHTNSGIYAFVAGESNAAIGDWSTVAGGKENMASGSQSTVAGGRTNAAIGFFSAVGGGNDDTASGNWSTVAGGWGNTAAGDRSAVAGGWDNTATGTSSTVSGGYDNTASAPYAAVGGGVHNTANQDWTTVAGGYENTATGLAASIGGGYANTTSGKGATVSGGDSNTVTFDFGTISGGKGNTAGGGSVVAGGLNNEASNQYASIGGGQGNVTLGAWSIIPGGLDNNADGIYSFAAGRRAKANHAGTFVWADQTDADFSSTASDQFLVRADGGVGINTNSPQGALDVSSTTGALIVPRMTTEQRDALTAVNGMIIYNTTTNQFNFYEDGTWVTK